MERSPSKTGITPDRQPRSGVKGAMINVTLWMEAALISIHKEYDCKTVHEPMYRLLSKLRIIHKKYI